MDLVLDGKGPLYHQVIRSLKAAMASGRIPDGSRLPASRELAHALGMSRTTIVAAYERLRAEGFLVGKVGAGSFASSPWAAASKRARPHVSEPPQSAFSRRSRELHDHDALPGRRLPGMRHAFQYGVPIVNNTLATTWTRTLAKVAPYVPPNYPAAQGFAALRNAVCEHIAQTRGVRCTPDDILIVGGVQQAVALITRVLLDPGDVVAVEEPQYFGTRQVLQMHGARLTGVPVDHDGLCVDRLGAFAVKLACVTPSHQFPTGAVLSLPRRRALLDYAKRCGSWIMEDDYDGEFRRNARALPALQSMDDDGRVIYVGSFSKTLFPALRIGYLVMPPGLREDFIAAKWAADFGSPALEQAALARLITHGAYERHLRYVNRKLAERRDVLLGALRDACGDRVEILPSNAGMHVFTWLRGMNAAEGDALIRHAEAHKLGLYSVAPCYLRPPDRAGLLMGYGAMSAKEIRDAVKVFATCLDEFQHRDSAVPGRPDSRLAHYA